MTKAERQEEVDCIKMIAKEALSNQPSSPIGFNNGFLWAVASVGGKNVKFLVGSHDPMNWIDCEVAVKNSCKEILHTYVNMD